MNENERSDEKWTCERNGKVNGKKKLIHELIKETNLEEGEKHVRIGAGQKNEGQESAETSVENSRADRWNGRGRAFVFRAGLGHERVRYVSSVVHAQTNGQNQIDARHCVYR